MARGASSRPQTALWERVIEHEDLAKTLDQREKLRGDVAAAKKRLDDVDSKAKAIIAELDIADAPVRVGRYVIVEKKIAGGPVNFTKNPSVRVQISLLPDDIE